MAFLPRFTDSPGGREGRRTERPRIQRMRLKLSDISGGRTATGRASTRVDSRCGSVFVVKAMKPSTKVMPVAAAVTALSTLACCLPLSLTAAVGIAGLSIAIEAFRNWLVSISLAFLAIGLFQFYRFKRTCRKSSRSGIVAFVLAALIVLGVYLFPQTIAVVLADLFP